MVDIARDSGVRGDNRVLFAYPDMLQCRCEAVAIATGTLPLPML